MEGYSGGYNPGQYVPNPSLQRPGFRGSPQPRVDEPARQSDMWQSNTGLNNTAVSSSIPYSYDQQYHPSNTNWAQNTNAVESLPPGNPDNFQYLSRNTSSQQYGQAPTSYLANNAPSYMQNNLASYTEPNYGPTDPGWSSTMSGLVYESSHNYDAYHPGMTSSPQNVTQGVQSDSLNWRSGNPSSDFNRQQIALPEQNSYYPGPQTDWKQFKNPLTDNSYEDDSPEALVQNMKAAADKAQTILEQTNRKPNTISKSALAVIERDLKKAAKPFESSESLKQFRDKQLGILDAEKQDKDFVSSMNNLYVGDLSNSKLSVNAVEFIPSSKTTAVVEATEDSSQSGAKSSHDSEIEAIALNLIDDCVDQVTCNPACFDSVVPHVIGVLRSYNLIQSAINVIVDKVYEMCVLERNFRYLGSQLCDQLSRTETGLPNFRSTLLNKAQEEFRAMDETIKNKPERARCFTQFMAELFLSLKYESESKLHRFQVLGRGTFGVVRKLIDHPNDDNIQCAVRVLKLTILKMEDSLRQDGKNSMEKLQSILVDLEAFYKSSPARWNKLTMTLLEGFVKLRATNWGRSNSVSSETSSQLPNPDVLSEQDENYYMNEPVFFTPSGVMYTAADAVDPDFYDNHLAPLSSQYQHAEPPQDSYRYDKENNSPALPVYQQANDSYSQNPLSVPSSTARDAPYVNWSSGDPADHYHDDTVQEDIRYQEDYDEEYEAFLRGM